MKRIRGVAASISRPVMEMKIGNQLKLLSSIFIAGIIAGLFGGCASDDPSTTGLRNLTDRQAEWFDRTDEGWRFEK